MTGEREIKELALMVGETIKSDICGVNLETQAKIQVAVWSL